MTATDDHSRSEVLDHLSLTLESSGFPRSMARVYSALTLAEGEGLSTSELMESLGISKASITNSMQLLLGIDLVQRYRVRGSREAHYRVLKDRWGADHDPQVRRLSARCAGPPRRRSSSPTRRPRESDSRRCATSTPSSSASCPTS